MGYHKTVATNRKAYYDYIILEKLEVGIVLTGPEVKILNQGRLNFGDAYAHIEEGQCWLYNLNILPKTTDNASKHRLLLHKKEILKLQAKAQTKGMTIIALEVYFSDRWVKVMLGIAKGKSHADKRAALKEKETKKELREAR